MSNNINLSSLKSKEMTVSIGEIARYNEVIDPLQRNVRREKSYNRPEQVDSIREIGLTTPLLVVKADPGVVSNDKRKYVPLQGFTRRESLETLNNQYPDGYKFGEGKDEVRKFDTVKVKVVDTSDPMTRLILKLDHGDYRGLDKVELFNSFEQMYLLQATEKDMAVRLRGSLEANYPPGKKLSEQPSPTNPDGTPKDSATFKKEYAAYENGLLKHFKGIIQQYKLICQAPLILREVCLAKLAGEKKWPTNEELRDAMQIYDKEISEDKTGMLSKENPGPAFKKWFDETKAIKDEAEKEGTIRGKTTAMMNAQQVRELEKQVTDPRLKRMIQIILRKVKITQLPVLDKVTASTPLTEEGRAIVVAMQEETVEESKDSTEEVKAEESNVSEELPV